MVQVQPHKTFTAEQLTHPDLNLIIQTIISAINNITGDQIPDATLELKHFSPNANPFQYLGELLCREAVTLGYTFVGAVGLVADIAPGRAYVLQDSDTSIPKKYVLVEKLVNSSVNLTANSDNYIDLTINGTFVVIAVAVGGIAPAITSDAIRLMKLTTDGATVIDDVFLAAPNVFPPTAAGALPDNLYIISHDVDWETKIICPSGLVKDSTGQFSIEVTETIEFDITDAGVNGMEIGETEDAELLYFLYLIADQAGAQTAALMASKSPTSPSLPGGFDIFRRVSTFFNDEDLNIMPFFQFNERYHHLTLGHLVVGEQPTMVLGPIAGQRIQDFADVDIRDFVPPSAKTGIINGWMIADASAGRGTVLVAGIPNYIGDPITDSAFAVSGVQGTDPDSLVPWTHGKPISIIGGGPLDNDHNFALEDVPILGTDGATFTYGLFQQNSNDPGGALHLAIRLAGYVDSFVDDDRDTP